MAFCRFEEDAAVKAALEARANFTVAAPPEPLPVLLWGQTSAEKAENLGFTAVERPGDLDDARDRGISATHRTSVWSRMHEHYPQVDRSGNPYARKRLLALHPEVQEGTFRSAYDRAGNLAGNLSHPAWRYILIHPEDRCGGKISFDELTRRKFREHAGFDIPAEIREKSGVNYNELENFPSERVIPENHPVHVFYKWYWEEGDGWSALHDASVRGVKEHRPDIITIAAPALRIASVYDSWGKVDALLHWTYAHPDPTRTAHTTDALIAMSKGSAPPKKVIAMTQLFTKRHYVMPYEKHDEPFWDAEDAPFKDADPEAQYFTISPDQLRGSFWSKISRPVDGIAYHGWESISPKRPDHNYQYTNPATRQALKEILHGVVKPLGPTFGRLEERSARVGFLESFASEMFAGRADYGWPFRSWKADAYLALLHAGLQPRVLFDDTIRRKGLDGLEVLVLIHCDVLTEEVAAAVKQFQDDGGIVVGDEHLAPGITPDIRWKTRGRPRDAARRKGNILGKASELQDKLEQAGFAFNFKSDDSEIILRMRRWGSSSYLFAVNDLRRAGDYLGQHNWVMEEGLPNTAMISVRHSKGAVYDLVAHRKVEAETEDHWLRFNHKFGPGDGTVFLLLDEPISNLKLNIPDTVKCGRETGIQIKITDSENQNIDALIPVQLLMFDPAGTEVDEIAGYYTVEDGELNIPWQPRAKSEQGKWILEVRELASGRSAQSGINLIH